MKSLNRFVFTFLMFVSIICCKQGDQPQVIDEDLCDAMKYGLRGTFKAESMEGTITFTEPVEGGLKGKMIFDGMDFSYMVCPYMIMHCIEGEIDMTCDGRTVKGHLLFISDNQFKLNETTYNRVK